MKSFKRVVVDADVMLYKVAFACQKKLYQLSSSSLHNGVIYEGSNKRLINTMIKSLDYYELEEGMYVQPLMSACMTVDSILQKYEELFQAEEVVMYLTGEGNYREKVATIKQYKGTRTQEKPVHFAALKKYLIHQRDAIVIDGAEADDAISMEMWKDPDNVVAITIDKDAQNTPGWIYNPDKQQLLSVTDSIARHNFWTQVLTGDTVDNIQGCKGIGPAKAEGILQDCMSDKDYYYACLEPYTELQCELHPNTDRQDCESWAKRDLAEMARLLWMSREKYDDWKCPIYDYARENTNYG